MSKILIDEATVKLALEAFSVIAISDNLDWIRHQAEQQAAALREALAEQPASGLNPLWVATHPDGLTTPQPAQQEPVDFASLLREAEEIVREKPTWKRFIDGTPLSNDIAVWMTVFAQDVARRASSLAQRKPLTDEQIEKLREKTFSTGNPYCPVDSKSMRKAARAIEAAHNIKE